MRVVYLHQYFNTPAMPGGTRSYEMARRLVRMGHEVEMVTSWREPTHHKGWFVTDEAGIRVHWLPLPYSNHMSYWERIRAFVAFAWASSRRAASLKVDVVFATSTPLTIVLPGMFASMRNRIPMVFEIRDLWPDVPIAMGIMTNPLTIRVARALEALAYRHATRVVALAPGMKEAACRRGVHADRIDVIPNGCDFDVFGREAVDPARLPGGNDGKAIVYIGTMGLANGITYVPRLAAELRRLAPTSRVRFYLVGDGRMRGEAVRLARELGVLDDYVYFIGTLTKRDAARWVAASDATIATYDGPEILYRDSVSNKFFDSIAAGKPVLANYSGFATVTAVQAGAGFILNRDPLQGAKDLLAVIDSPDALASAGRAALRLARERFSRDEFAAALEQTLQRALIEHSARP